MTVPIPGIVAKAYLYRSGRSSFCSTARLPLTLLPLLLLLLLAAPARAQVKILPLGDSITQANQDHNSYRRALYHLLQQAGYAINFVGSHNQNYQGSPPNPDFDLDHEGHWGWRADQVLEGCSGCSSATGSGKLSEWLQQNVPDVVLLHLGTNDMKEDGMDRKVVDQTISELGQIIDELRRANPQVTVLLAQLIPAAGGVRSRRIPKLNAQIPELAAAKDQAGSSVVVVDQYTGFDAVADTYDGLHPNEQGEEKMAQQWFAALRGVLGAGSGNASPEAVLEASTSSGEAPLAVSFDGSSSYDSDGRIIYYSWDFGDGTTGSGAQVSHTYTQGGSYQARLTVTDDGGATATATESITVTEPTSEPGGGSEGSTQTLPALADAYVRGGSYADTNYGREEAMAVKNARNESNMRESYLRFDLSGVSGTVARAVVRLAVASLGAEGQVHEAALVGDQTWQEHTLTWNSRPASGAVLGQWTPVEGQVVELDVTEAVQQAGGSSLSLHIYAPTRGGGSDWVYYWSREKAEPELRPTLLITSSGDETSHVLADGSSVVSSAMDLPAQYVLHANYPNPFNPATLIRYDLPEQVHVRLDVFDLTGRRVEVLVDQVQPAGAYEARFAAENLPSGMYLYRLRAGSFEQTGKMILMK